MRTSTFMIAVPTEPSLWRNSWLYVAKGVLSVSPYPSLTSSPKRSFHRLATSPGSDDAAEKQ